MGGSEKSGTTPTETGRDPGPRAVGQPTVLPNVLAADERFDDLLGRLREVVEKLENGNLSLEDSLKFFEEGIDLCRRGATILDSAERKVEVLLAGPGSTNRTAPFDAQSGDGD
jgi:exodeoxyribonuclease VII small subunit